MTKRIISDDSNSTGIVTSFDYDADKDEAIIHKEQDVTAIIEANKAEFNSAPERWGEWTKVGSIPLSVYYELERQGITQDQKAMAKWLNDPDNLYFRTRPGTI
jgi:hypothetical protein